MHLMIPTRAKLWGSFLYFHVQAQVSSVVTFSLPTISLGGPRARLNLITHLGQKERGQTHVQAILNEANFPRVMHAH